MRLSSAIASLAMLTIAATAEWVTIKPEAIKCMKDFPWDHCPSTWKEMDDVPQGKCDPVDPVSENETSGGSPTVDDCFALGHNLPKGKGWVRKDQGFRTILGWGSCRFGIDTTPAKSNGMDVYFYITTDDIRYLINHSIAYGWQDHDGTKLVGAKGQTTCSVDYYKGSGNPHNTTVNWALYKVGTP